MTGKKQVLVDSGEFKVRMEELVAEASKSIYVQAMSFEGDAAGEWLIDVLIESGVPDIQLCLDSYSKFVINDQFIHSLTYLNDEAFRNEVKNTKAIIKKAEAAGIKVRYTNPLGFLFTKYPWRNHKKMVIIDDQIAFIGGINFCDHNFEWHDMMVEILDSSLCRAMSDDFKSTFSGINQSTSFEGENSKVYFLNGLTSKDYYEEIFALMKNAKKKVQIFSPYVSDPLLSYLRNEVPREIEIDIISPATNNKNIFKTILTSELQKGYFTLHQYQGRMSHLKAILVDGETLIAGSSNFDFVSYYFEQEVVLVTQDQETVRSFIDGIAEPDLAKSIALTEDGIENTNKVIPLIFKGINRLSHVVATVTSGN